MKKTKRLVKSFQYAFRGLLKTVKEEQNIRIQLSAAAIVGVAGLYFKLKGLEWALIIFAAGLVILTEIINSAVERVSDVLKPRLNGYVKEIKDIMAAAVMLSSITAALIGLIIFIPKFIG